MRAVSGNLRDGACFKLDKTNMARVHRIRLLKIKSSKLCDIWRNFYFHRILNSEDFKVEGEQMSFVTHLIITVQLYY